ncbi:unnamed protein product [Closterium sp. Naga37s-1]|nr:unnamed protein product [Closterium sp. Naga37s-1]
MSESAVLARDAHPSPTCMPRLPCLSPASASAKHAAAAAAAPLLSPEGPGGQPDSSATEEGKSAEAQRACRVSVAVLAVKDLKDGAIKDVIDAARQAANLLQVPTMALIKVENSHFCTKEIKGKLAEGKGKAGEKGGKKGKGEDGKGGAADGEVQAEAQTVEAQAETQGEVHSGEAQAAEGQAEGLIEVNQGHAFTVKDETTATVSVALVHCALGRGAVAIGLKQVVGAIEPLSVASLLELDPDKAVEPRWYDLRAPTGKKGAVVGRVLLQAVAARAPPEQRVSLFIGSWNVGNAPPAADLSPWLPVSGRHDLIAIGSQECEYAPRAGHATCMDDWVACIRTHFGPRYRLVKGASRGQMRLVVLVLDSSQRAVTNVMEESSAGMSGKGGGAKPGTSRMQNSSSGDDVAAGGGGEAGAAIGASLRSSPGGDLCNGREEGGGMGAGAGERGNGGGEGGVGEGEVVGEERNGDGGGMAGGQLSPMLGGGGGGGGEGMREEGAATPGEGGSTPGGGEEGDSTASKEHKRVLSAGSLALFRGGAGQEKVSKDAASLASKKSQEKQARAAVHESTLEQIRNREFNALLEYDELQREIRESRGFYKFQEAPITFAPTFKVIRNEVGKYNSKRLPAWCDRVLWRSLPGCQLACTRYDAAHDVGSSDHKPVLAEFELTTHALPVGLDPADAPLVAAEEGAVGAVVRRLHRSASSRHGDMRWHIQFSSLMGSDLLSADANGLSDPYVRFTGPNLQHSSHTKPRYKTLNPVWTPEDMSSIVLENLSLQSHEKDYLLAAILDHDVTNQDDPIGFTTIPLAPAVHALRANNGSPFVDFKVEVTHKGMPAGHLQGSFRLAWAATKHRSSKCAQM